MSKLSPRARAIRRVVVATVGSTLLVAGIVMMILPGPGVVTILAGLTVLASEFHWARRVKRRMIVWVRRRTQRKKAQSQVANNPVANNPVEIEAPNSDTSNPHASNSDAPRLP